MPFNKQYTVIVPSAGIGKRMRTDIPKQYLKIAGKTVLEHTVENLLAHPHIAMVLVVLSPNDCTFEQLPIAEDKRVKTAIGGKERADSVLAGLNALTSENEWVLVHDAARPCISKNDISALLNIAEQTAIGGLLATPVRDTMKRGNDETSGHYHSIKHTESRDNLWHALTPQFFDSTLLKKALNQAKKEDSVVTDEASAIELLGEQVLLVPGQASNIKITQPEDLQLAEFYLTQLNDTKTRENE